MNSSPTTKVFLIGLIVGLLQIPALALGSLISAAQSSYGPNSADYLLLLLTWIVLVGIFAKLIEAGRVGSFPAGLKLGISTIIVSWVVIFAGTISHTFSASIGLSAYVLPGLLFGVVAAALWTMQNIKLFQKSKK